MAKLSRRQGEIVILLTRGESPKAIARQLGISHSTVRKHMHTARSRTNCRTSFELAFKASQEMKK